MRILFDHSAPAPLRHALTGHVVVEAVERVYSVTPVWSRGKHTGGEDHAMKNACALFVLMLFSGVAQWTTPARSEEASFPRATWEKAAAPEMGGSSQKLEEARQFFGSSGKRVDDFRGL
jgi:hypothetical protein